METKASLTITIPDKLTFNYAEAFKILGFSRTIGDIEVQTGALKTVLVGKRPKISRKDLLDYAERKGLI